MFILQGTVGRDPRHIIFVLLSPRSVQCCAKDIRAGFKDKAHPDPELKENPLSDVIRNPITITIIWGKTISFALWSGPGLGVWECYNR